MLHSIPAVSRVAGQFRWFSSSLVYLATSVLGATLLGTLLGVAGMYPVHWIGIDHAVIVVAIALCIFGLIDLQVLRVPRIQRDAQVPEWWRWHFAPEVSSALYGAMLGAGVLTKISFANFYAIMVWSLFSGSVTAAILIMGTYGLCRALPVVIVAWLYESPGQIERLTWRLVGFHRLIGALGGTLLLVVAFHLSS